MKISVIMPSFLGTLDVEGAASNRQQKFIRAVNSFLRQTHKDKEIIIISDGCNDTIRIVENNYKKELKGGVIKLLKLEKHPPFTGIVRQRGIDISDGVIITNLDSDDIYQSHHLQNIDVSFNTDKSDWVYFNNIVKPDGLDVTMFYQNVSPELGKLCNANIAWRRDIDVTWTGCDGRHDNQLFIKQLIDKYPRHKKIYGCGYEIHNIIIQKR